MRGLYLFRDLQKYGLSVTDKILKMVILRCEIAIYRYLFPVSCSSLYISF